MNNELKELARYRLERAKEDLDNAVVNYKDNYLKGSLNRSYYAIFHSIRAINALSGFDSKKHSGVIAYFNQYYIKTQKLDIELSSIVQQAFKIRNKSDYDDFYIVSRIEVEEQLQNAKFFVTVVERYLKELTII